MRPDLPLMDQSLSLCMNYLPLTLSQVKQNETLCHITLRHQHDLSAHFMPSK